MTAPLHTGPWFPASADPLSGPAAWHGAQVGDDVQLEVWLGPRNAVGAQYFRCFLTSEQGRPEEPVVFGLQNTGPFPGFCWVEVIEYRDVLRMPDGNTVAVPPGIELRIFQELASLVPPGGHMMVEYDSACRVLTAQALGVRVPPLATPLGATLRAAGIGDAFRDWYIAEGGREGPRKLQAFRAADDGHARERGLEMLGALRTFMVGSGDLDWGLQAKIRPLADAAITELSGLYET